MDGQWRDYAIDQGPSHAAFSVFRRSTDRPIYTIYKLASGGGEYALYSGRKAVARGSELTEVLSVLQRSIKLVSS